jgi:chemotaxis signal transduction protein
MGAAEPQVMAEIKELEQKLAELRSRVVGKIEREQLPDGPMPLLLFRLGKDRVAILQSHVIEVVMISKLTPLPEAPAWIPGVLNCRGKSVLVLDALARVSRCARRPELSDLIVIVEHHGRRIGLVVQEILGVETAPREALQAPSKDLDQAPYLLGVIHHAGKATLLFSLGALLGTSGLPAVAQ